MICPKCGQNKPKIDFLFPKCHTHRPELQCIDCYDTSECQEDEFNCRMVWIGSESIFKQLEERQAKDNYYESNSQNSSI